MAQKATLYQQWQSWSHTSLLFIIYTLQPLHPFQPLLDLTSSQSQVGLHINSQKFDHLLLFSLKSDEGLILSDLMQDFCCLLILIWVGLYLLFWMAVRHWRCLSSCISSTLSWKGPAKKCPPSVLIRLVLILRIIILSNNLISAQAPISYCKPEISGFPACWSSYISSD